MFSFEEGPDIDAVSNMSEFLGDALNMFDNDSAPIYCVNIFVLMYHCHLQVINNLFIQ
jgi:hypothetical protein